MEYKFSGVVTLKDYIQFSKILLKKSENFILIAMAAFAIFGIFKGGVYFKIWCILFAVAMICKFFVIIAYKKKYYSSNKFFQDEQYFVVNERFIKITIPSLQTVITKNEICKVEFDKDSIYLFITEDTVYIIKKRFFENSDEFDELKEFVKQYYM
jgi:hypothetical protein